jgi:quercetin dioxygenase-like cupin family protein
MEAPGGFLHPLGAFLFCLSKIPLLLISNKFQFLKKEERIMATKKSMWVLFTTLVFGIAIGLGLQIAIGQQTPPTQPKGMKVIKASALDLGPQIEEMRGWRLGMRVVQMESGGHFVMHSHKDRPGMGYVVKGVLTEQRGGKTTELHVGDIMVEDKETTHWIENNGTEPVLLLAVDIMKAP